MKMRTVLKTVLIGVSYYSFKKVIDKIKEPYRHIAVFSLRMCVFFLIFLSMYAFLSGRIISIAANMSLPDLMKNIFMGICFFISFVVSFLLTAVCEEIYRKLSELEKITAQKIDTVKESVAEPFDKIKESLARTKSGIKKTFSIAGTTATYMYDTSCKITSVAVLAVVKGYARIVRKHQEKREDIVKNENANIENEKTTGENENR